MRANRMWLALAASVFPACSSVGEAAVKIKVPGIEVNFETEWAFDGPEDFCGCVIFKDANGDDMSAEGEIVNGHGSGDLPPGARGWEIDLVPCKDWDGCEDGNTGPALPPPSTDPMRRFESGHRFLGSEVRVDRILFYDFTVDASDTQTARAVRDSLLENLETADLPEGVRIRDLVVYYPTLDEGGNLLYLEGLALDEEPIASFSLTVNGTVETTVAGSLYLGHGFWGVPHVLSTDNLDLSWPEVHNEFEFRRKTHGDALVQSEVGLDWDTGS